MMLDLETASNFGMCSRHQGKKLSAQGPVPASHWLEKLRYDP